MFSLRPNCFDCHLEHYTPSTEDPAWKLSLIKECGNCHAKEINTYRKTYHGKVTRLSYATMAKCSDCHGFHMILPVKNDSSRISKNNILGTCRTCHRNATEGFTKFYAHSALMLNDMKERYGVINKETAARVRDHLKRAIRLSEKIDVPGQVNDALREEIFSLNTLDSVCDKHELEWPIKGFKLNVLSVLKLICQKIINMPKSPVS